MKETIKRIIRDFHIKKLPEFKPRHLQVPLDIKKNHCEVVPNFYTIFCVCKYH